MVPFLPVTSTWKSSVLNESSSRKSSVLKGSSPRRASVPQESSARWKTCSLQAASSLPPTFRVRRTNRRTMALEITPEAELLVRAPMYASSEEIQRFVRENLAWIQTHMERVRARNAAREAERAAHPVHLLSESEIRLLAEQALQDLPQRAAHFAPLLGVTYGRITIRNQRTRWGSCSSKGNLNFNCLLMLAPEEVRDYVVVHELCHRLEMNHSPRFWALVERILPDYRTQKKWLREHGRSLMEQMTG